MYGKRQDVLHDARNVDERATEVWEILAPDIESIESIGAVRAVFEQVFLGFGEFLTGLVFTETVAAAFHSCRLNSEDKVIVILAVEVWGETVLSGETAVDQVVLLIMDCIKPKSIYFSVP